MINEFLEQFKLSPARREVAVEMLSSGDTAEVIGNRLFISTATVKNHCYSIYKVTNCSGRAELQARYIQFLENKLEGMR